MQLHEPDHMTIRIRAHGEAPVPGFPPHQILLTDPTGAKVQPTFDMPA